MTHARWIRLALAYLGVVSLEIGVWAVLAPRSFYDDFPGLGRSWISVDGPYNEHLIRDVGALNLALAAVVAIAAISMQRSAIVTAAVASLLWGVPHVAYHVLNTDGQAAGDVVASVAGLVAFALLPVALIVTAVRTPQPSGTHD